MIANFFKQSKPIVFLILGILMSLFYFLEVFTNQSSLVDLLDIVQVTLNYLLLVLVFFVIDYNLKYFEIQKGHSFIMLCFVLIAVFLMPEITFGIDFYAFVILSFAIIRLFNLSYGVKIESSIFEAVFLIGIASFFYKPVILFLLLVLVATLVFTNSHWRYFVIPILSLSALVVLVQMYFLYVYDTPAGLSDLLPQFRTDIDFFDSDLDIYLFTFWVICALLCFYQIYLVKQVRSLYHRQMATFFLVFILLSFLMVFFQSFTIPDLWLMSLWPFSIYLGDFVSRIKKKLWFHIVFWVLVVVPISFYVLRYYQI